ncbi:hypothetical protein HNQ07_004790 [Deinococcus metalli]|uniref:Uncharacterized protein n=1 Tax=Deinococcus metalli TaxID=1141878 RepID=A0A7W8KJV2_9DEIO|nr:hypothetical protein [Deinococcus metalli]MBB5379275.1 hypothetical protein [Deinococcus metalli]GHF65949.1 hypothetical protein GCM10017781_47070 [Deinococcus metalli]
MRTIVISEEGFLKILHPELRSPEEEARRLRVLARAEGSTAVLGPLTDERLSAGIPFLRPRKLKDQLQDAQGSEPPSDDSHSS